MRDPSAYHLESASDAFVRAYAAALEGWFTLGTACMTALQEYSSMCQSSRGSAAIKLIEKSHFGEHQVIHLKSR